MTVSPWWKYEARTRRMEPWSLRQNRTWTRAISYLVISHMMSCAIYTCFSCFFLVICLVFSLHSVTLLTMTDSTHGNGTADRQVLAHSRYGRAADLWSFGCVVIAARCKSSLYRTSPWLNPSNLTYLYNPYPSYMSHSLHFIAWSD